MAKPIRYCIVEGCKGRCHGNGLCNLHYRRKQRTGSLETSRVDNKYTETCDSFVVTVKNGVFVIDKDKRYIVEKYYWYIDTSNGYVSAKEKRKKIYLHQLLIGKELGKITDHINRNKLDNRMDNLRLVDSGVNVSNRSGYSKTGYKYVYLSKGKYQVKGGYPKRKHIGTFNTLEKAVRARNLSGDLLAAL